MQKLLERESQRCQDLLNSDESSKLGTGDNTSKNSDEVRGLESIIKRQNDMIESYRQKVLSLEEKLKT